MDNIMRSNMYVTSKTWVNLRQALHLNISSRGKEIRRRLNNNILTLLHTDTAVLNLLKNGKPVLNFFQQNKI